MATHFWNTAVLLRKLVCVLRNMHFTLNSNARGTDYNNQYLWQSNDYFLFTLSDGSLTAPVRFLWILF